MQLYGGFETEGSKCVCAVGTSPATIRAEPCFATTTPDKTLERAVAFFTPYRDRLVAIGIGSFGPLDARPGSPTFGHITTTPKAGWPNTDVVGVMRHALQVPIAFDTDVNAAALGEHRWGAVQGLDTFVYLTVGTGVGGGGMVNGQILHGLLHPEMGHLRIPHNWQADPFVGDGVFHGDCLEGLASGSAIKARWKQAGDRPFLFVHTSPKTIHT